MIMEETPGEPRDSKEVITQQIKDLLEKTKQEAESYTPEQRLDAGYKVAEEAGGLLRQLYEGPLSLEEAKTYYYGICFDVRAQIMQLSMDYYKAVVDTHPRDKEEIVAKMLQLQRKAKDVMYDAAIMLHAAACRPLPERQQSHLSPDEMACQGSRKIIDEAFQITRTYQKTISLAEMLYERTEGALRCMKKRLGGDNAYYIESSSEVANHAVSYMLQDMSAYMANFYKFKPKGINETELIEDYIEDMAAPAHSLLTKLEKMDLDAEARKRCNDCMDLLCIMVQDLEWFNALPETAESAKARRKKENIRHAKNVWTDALISILFLILGGVITCVASAP